MINVKEKNIISGDQERERAQLVTLLADLESEKKQADNTRIANVWAAISDDLLIIQDKVHRSKGKRVQRLINIVACLIVIAAISIPVAIANNPWFRSIVYRLVIEEDADGITTKLEPNSDEAFMVPIEWEGVYFPISIAKSFDVVTISSATSIELIDRSQRLLLIEEHLPQDAAWINTIGKKVEKKTLIGKELYVIEGDGNCTIILPMDERLLIVSSDSIAKSELMEICSSVKHVIR